MTDKAYIVANEQQEREVLERFEQEDLEWLGFVDKIKKPTDLIPSHYAHEFYFPYFLTSRGTNVYWGQVEQLGAEEIVFDGRKEELMDEKYVVSQEFMEELEEWKKRGNAETYFVGSCDISMLPNDIKRWWNHPEINNFECNNRLIAIISWVNGKDVFELEHKKWIVRSKDVGNQGEYRYVFLRSVSGLQEAKMVYEQAVATHFDTKAEAEEWCNSHQEAIKIDID